MDRAHRTRPPTGPLEIPAPRTPPDGPAAAAVGAGAPGAVASGAVASGAVVPGAVAQSARFAAPTVSDEPVQLRPDPLRWRVIDRLVFAGQRHASHLHARRTTPAARPARHAVVFVFQQPPDGLDDGLRIASRMFLHGGEVDDATGLSVILSGLADRVADYRRARLHPLPRIVDRAEPMTQVRYLATATSSLDPPHDVDSADSPDGNPAAPRGWRGLAHLVDGTRIVAHHRLDPTALVPDTTALTVAATHTLAQHTALEPFGRLRPWRYLTDTDLADANLADANLADADSSGADLAGTLAALERLHAVIVDSEHHPRRRRTA